MSTAPILYSTDNVEDFALDPIEQAIADIAAGRPVVVVDDEDRENEGDLVIAAEKVTPEIVAFMMSECRGLICAPMEGEELDRLELPQMVDNNTESMRTAFTVSVDAGGAHGVTTGISASDRATTLRLLAGGEAGPGDFVRPGHIFPLRARPGGVLVRNGHTEAAVDLARLAGLRPAGAIVEIAGEDGHMLRLPELVPFARKHGLTIVSIEDLVAYRRSPKLSALSGRRTPGHRTRPRPSPPSAVRPRFTCPPASASSPPTATGRPRTAWSTSPSSAARSATARTSWSACTPNASPETCSTLYAATAAPAGGLPGAHPGGRQGSGGLSARSRGARHRADVQAARVRTPGARSRHPGRQPRAGPSRGRPRLRAGARILADLGVRSVRLMTNNPDKTEALLRHGLGVTRREPMPVQAGE